MERTVGVTLSAELTEATEAVFAIAVSSGYTTTHERIRYSFNGSPLTPVELPDIHGGRLHIFDVQPGTLKLDYLATVTGIADPPPVDALDLITYTRPSRYCESDTLAPIARAEFGNLTGRALLDAVSSYVGTRLSYVPGSSGPTDGAVSTLLSRQGVCRDYAHLVIALLRALDVPARLVAVYAPGLDPMDFHAVAEAYVCGAWQVVDATALAPRQSFVRIATGRDAADTAFLTNLGGGLILTSLTVTAVVDALDRDDVRDLVSIH